MQEAEVQRRFAKLGESLWERLQRARRASAVPGNLRWQNPHFVGRREELRKLHEQLSLGTIGVVSAVHGLGGQGKTELAVAYAHAWADCYPAGLWSLAAEGRRELLPLIGNLAWERSLGFTPTEAEKNDPVLLGRGVLAHLKTNAEQARNEDPDRGAATLLLLDNVSEPDLLSAAQLATLPGGLSASWLRIVATTRLEVHEQKGRLAVLPVDALDEESALSLIRDHQPPRQRSRHAPHDEPNGTNDHDPQGTPDFASAAEEAAAREIVRALGGFTLAVEQVALYLGLHPEVSPSSFLQTLRDRGLPVTDELTRRDPDVAAQMLTQSKQLGLILDATLARLAGPARTALQFAALLPADSVPWPWLRELTVARHPEVGQPDDLGADPWLALRRRLEGLRLLTGGDQPEIARIHRLLAAHLRLKFAHQPERILEEYLFQRGAAVAQTAETPLAWELDALLIALPMMLGHDTPPTEQRRLTALVAGDFSERLRTYRSLPAVQQILLPTHTYLQRLAESDPANAAWQRDLSVSFNRLGDLATAQGNLPEAQRLFGEALRIRQRLAESDPANAAWQRDLSVSFNQLGDLATAQGNLPEAERLFGEDLRIAQRLAESDPANAEWQRNLASSYQRIATASESSSVANEYLGRCLQTLEHMRNTGMHLDPDTVRVYQQLAERIGKSSSSVFAFDGSRSSSIGSPVLPSRSSQDSRLDELAMTRLKKDDVPGAMNLLRQQLFPHDSIIMNQKTDLRIRIVFLKALMLDNNVEGLRKYLPSILEQDHPEIRKIATAFEQWTKSRSLTQRLGLWPSPRLPKPDLIGTS